MEKVFNGLVYIIKSNLGEKIYIGSTTKDINCRFKLHTDKYKLGILECCSSIMFDEYGVDNCYIEVLEYFPNITKTELRKQEGHYQKLYLSDHLTNRCIAGRTPNEYYLDNMEKIKIHSKNYKLNHIEHYKAIDKKYRDENKEKISERKKEWYKKNKQKCQDKNKLTYEKDKDKRCAKVLCECGAIISNQHLNLHKKTQKHTKLVTPKDIELNVNTETDSK